MRKVVLEKGGEDPLLRTDVSFFFTNRSGGKLRGPVGEEGTDDRVTGVSLGPRNSDSGDDPTGWDRELKVRGN